MSLTVRRKRSSVKLRTRLILAAVYILTVVVIGLEVPLAITISRSATRETEASILSNAVLVAARINDDVPRFGDPTGPPANPNQREVRASIARIVAAAAAPLPDARIVVTNGAGWLLADSDGLAPVGTLFATSDRPEFATVFSQPGGRIDIRDRTSDTAGGDLLLVTAPVVHFQEVVGAVRISEPLGALQARIHRTWIGLGLIGLAAILTGLALAWLLAAALARRVRRLADTASQLGQGDLDARAEVEGPQEVQALAESFNRMADDLSSNIHAQQDFLANASHQLRTPLTGLQLRLEAIEAEGGASGEQAKKAQGEVRRLNDLVDDLLKLARATSAETAAELVDLSALAAEAVGRWAAPAEDVGKLIRPHVDGPCPVWANSDDLGHVLDNLIENSIRYGGEGAEITVETKRDGRAAVLAVCDTGPGIPAEERDRVFERFYRGATGRKSGPGTGLGLAVVDELVRRWGGRVRLEHGPGTTIETRFPAAGGRPTVS